MKCILSFDDGPHRVYTAKLLDILAYYETKAVFFVIGKHAVEHPDLIRRIRAEDHEVGNHTYTHQRLVQLSTQQIEEEINSTQIAIQTILHESPRLFRPPYGEYDMRTQQVCEKKGLEIVIWNVDSKDWKETNSSVIVQNILENVRPGSTILFHDLPPTIESLPTIIEVLHEKNFL